MTDAGRCEQCRDERRHPAGADDGDRRITPADEHVLGPVAVLDAQRSQVRREAWHLGRAVVPRWTGDEARGGERLEGGGRNGGLLAATRDQAADRCLIDAVDNHPAGAELELDLPGGAPEQPC
jgi:hypothetical protein